MWRRRQLHFANSGASAMQDTQRQCGFDAVPFNRAKRFGRESLVQDADGKNGLWRQRAPGIARLFARILLELTQQALYGSAIRFRWVRFSRFVNDNAPQKRRAG